MKTNVEELSKVKKKVFVEVEAKEVTRKLNEVYKDLGKRAKIPGFRPGKIPRQILERRFGRQVTDDVTRDLVNETLPKALEETEIYPLSMPIVENENLKENKKFNYSAVIEVKPEIHLKEYTEIEVEKEISSVTDEVVEKELEMIRTNQGKLETVEEDRSVKEEDYVLIDYEGFEEDQPIEGINSENFLLKVGSGDFHKEFEKGLIGLKREGSADIDVDFEGEHQNVKLAGKKVRFKVKVLEIKKMVIPELNDEFAKGLGADFEDLPALQDKLREEITKREETRIDRELKKRLMDKISAKVEFEIPESLVESEINMAVDNVNQNIMRAGSTFEKAGLDVEKLKKDFRPISERKVKDRLILGEIAKQDKLDISEPEMNEGFNDVASKVGQDAQVVRQYYEANNLLDSFRESLLEEKTLNSLVNSANVLEVEADKLTKDDEEK